jgi:hypothetical protein
VVFVPEVMPNLVPPAFLIVYPAMAMPWSLFATPVALKTPYREKSSQAWNFLMNTAFQSLLYA